MPKVREDLEGFKPYRVPQPKAKIELDSNENPWDLPAEMRQDIERLLADFKFNRYPDISAASLRKTIAFYHGLGEDNVLVGNGSNEVILYLMLAFGGPGRTALIFEPTYSMHSVIARISGTAVREVPRQPDFSIDLDEALREASAARPDIIFVCSPNNPTGNTTPTSQIEQIILAADSLVIVDEAYGEFSQESVADLIQKYPNLAVIKTFSKAFRLAALRVGYLLASQDIVESLGKVKLPYNLNAFSQAVAELAFSKRDQLLEVLAEIVRERDRVLSELKKVAGLTVYPSQANFVLFRTEKDANQVFDLLLEQGILVRNFTHKEGLKNCLRVTIGTAEENEAFLAALKGIV